jgi:hypothetical protein
MEHGGRAGVTLLLVPPGNVEGLAKDIRKASNYLIVHTERAGLGGSPGQYAPISQISQREPEEVARTIIVCSKSCFSTRFFSEGRLFLSSSGHKMSAEAMIMDGTTSANIQAKIPVARIVIDESHTIRNIKAKFLRALMLAPCPVWFLTGSVSNLAPKDTAGLVEVWSKSNGEKYLKEKATEMHRRNNLLELHSLYTKLLNARTEEPELPPSSEERMRVLRDLATESPKRWIDECPEVRAWLTWYSLELNLGKLVDEYSQFSHKTMIIRTKTSVIWGEPLIKLPLSIDEDVNVEFLDDCYMSAYHQEFQRAKDEVRAIFERQSIGTKKTFAKYNYLSRFRFSRICASIPILRLDSEFMSMGLTSQDCIPENAYVGACPFTKRLPDIVRSSKKLQWLREFVSQLGEAEDPDTGLVYPEKLVVFAGIPVVAYVIWVAGYFLSIEVVPPTDDLVGLARSCTHTRTS